MWTCPKCGREFKRTNQGHYCGKAPENVNDYIEFQTPEARDHLAAIRSIILSSVPDIKERIAWSMPVYENEKGSVSFSACKSHVSLYADMDVLDNFKQQLSGYVIKKKAVYFPYSKALPEKVIEGIVKQCFETR